MLTCEEYEVVRRLDLECLDFRLGYDHPWIAPVLDLLGFNVAERPRDREPPRKHSEGPHYQLLLHLVWGVCCGNPRYRLSPISL